MGRSDSTAFTNRLSDLRPTGATSARRAVVVSRCVGSHLARMRSLGVTRPGEPLHGLPDDSWPKTSPTRPRTPKQVMTSRPSSCGKSEAMPSHEEIRRVRQLIRRVKDGMDELDEYQRAENE